MSIFAKINELENVYMGLFFLHFFGW